MEDLSVSIDLGSALPYLEQRFLKFFGKDELSREAADWFQSLQKTAMKQTSRVQCVGMHNPLPFASIYQPTRLRLTQQAKRNVESFAYQDKASSSILRGREIEARVISVSQFLAMGEDTIIYAGPGWGKTTFLHHIFRSSINDSALLPVLITLRRPTAVEDLERLVQTVTNLQKKQHKARTLLLVDGYDELSVQDRRRVSEALVRYQSLEIGTFCLTCREYYEVFQLTAQEVRIDGFCKEDKYRFVQAFLSAFRCPLNANEVVDDFEARGFSDFLSHPLLLALACIVKTSNSSIQPRSAIRLLERSLDVLCYRWDEKKGIDRQALTPLDGKDRLAVLKRIAYVGKSSYLPHHRAAGVARKELALLTFDKVDPRQVLMETAQFYGILVPTDEGWEFVHRTLHDFLAAQYSVETGEFAKVTRHEWNSRTAYAACLSHDSTSILEAALLAEHGLPTVTEILSNSPKFDMKRIAQAILDYFSRPGHVSSVDRSTPMRITGRLQTDFVRLANTRFLEFLIETLAPMRKATSDLIVGYCLFELYSRGLKLDFVTYMKAMTEYGHENFTFNLLALGQVQLSFVKPTKQSVSHEPNAADWPRA